MRKKITSFVLAFVIVLGLCIPVSASTVDIDAEYSPSVINIDEEIERALNGETDLDVDASIVASAWLEDEFGNVEDVEVFVTTRVLPLMRSANKDSKLYATTVVSSSEVKSEVKSKELDGVTGTVTLYWIDNPGVKNELVSVNGSWQIVENPGTGKTATLDNKKVYLKGKYAFGGEEQNKTVDIEDEVNSFEIDGSTLRSGYTTYTATSSARINKKDSRQLKVTAETRFTS